MVRDTVHRISTAEYRRMVGAGALEGIAVQLLDGLLIDVSPQGEIHARIIRALMASFVGRLDLLRIQMPLDVAEGWVPEPDVALAEDNPDPNRHPTSALLTVEVSVSSQAVDRRKAAAYAAAGIPRYWLVDVPAETVLEFTEPGEDGYAVVARLTGGDVLAAQVEGASTLTVAALLAR